MLLGRLRLPAAALAAGLPVLLAGMLAAPSARVLVGPTDDTVRTENVDPAPASRTDADLGLDGAHPPVSSAPQVEDAVRRDPGDGGDGSRGVPIRVSGTALPARVLIAYRHAADALRRSDPACHLQWSLVAAIGQVESGHAYGGALDRGGRTLSPILGPVLDGAGDVAAISDSDGGQLDGDSTWDRAVGPMQFIPTSWAVWGRDGDGDGRSDPSDIDDAALATASYLCAGARDLAEEKDRRSAVFSYNHSWDYVDLVLAWADAYATGTPVSTTVRPVASRDDATGHRADRVVADEPVSSPAAAAATTPATIQPAPTPAPPPPTAPSPTPALAAPPPAPAAPTVAADPAPSSSPPPPADPVPVDAPTPACPSATPTDPPAPTVAASETPAPDTDTDTDTDRRRPGRHADPDPGRDRLPHAHGLISRKGTDFDLSAVEDAVNLVETRPTPMATQR